MSPVYNKKPLFCKETHYLIFNQIKEQITKWFWNKQLILFDIHPKSDLTFYKFVPLKWR